MKNPSMPVVPTVTIVPAGFDDSKRTTRSLPAVFESTPQIVTARVSAHAQNPVNVAARARYGRIFHSVEHRSVKGEGLADRQLGTRHSSGSQRDVAHVNEPRERFCLQQHARH